MITRRPCLRTVTRRAHRLRIREKPRSQPGRLNNKLRELALLRALGARRGQVFATVAGEAALLGAVAAGVGVLAGVGLARGLAGLLATFGLSLRSTGWSCRRQGRPQRSVPGW